MNERFVGHTSSLSFAEWSRRWSPALVLAAGFSLLAGLAAWRFGWNFTGLTTSVYAWILLTFAVIDLEQRLVPDRLLLISLPIVLALNLLVQHPDILSTFLGALLGLALFAFVRYARPDGMGWGDVKLAGLIGLMVGSPNVVFALLLGMIAGGVAALLLIYRGKDRRQTMAYAPYLAIGGWIVLYFA